MSLLFNINKPSAKFYGGGFIFKEDVLINE